MDSPNLPHNVADDYLPSRPNFVLSLIAALVLLCGVAVIVVRSTFGF